MTFKMFKNLRLFITVRHICSWQHQLLQGEDGHQRGSLWSLLASHLSKKLFLPGLFDIMLCEMNMWDPQRNDC